MNWYNENKEATGIFPHVWPEVSLFPPFLSYWQQPIVLRNTPSLVVKSKWRWKVILLPFTRFLCVLWAT